MSTGSSIRYGDHARKLIGKPTFAESDTRDRFLSSLFLLLYAVFFYSIYRDYISFEWGYTGLQFRTLGGIEAGVIFSAIIVQGWLMPQRIWSPSSVILWLLTTLIFVPTMIITVMVGERQPEDYFIELVALAVTMAAAAIACSKPPSTKVNVSPPKQFYFIFLAVFVVFSAVLIWQFGSIMAFSEIDEVYAQRFTASDLNAAGVIGYIRTHYLYVFSSVLFVSGFMNRRYTVLSAIGFGGYFITYLIDASKIAFVIPLLISGFYMVHRFARGKVWALNSGLAGLTLLCTQVVQYFPGLKVLADLVLVRSIAIPAHTYAQYSDVFSARGYTYWGHVRGISAIVPPPDAFASDPFWPTLGQIVGANFYGMDSRVNLNANLFSGEGIAASGALGVIVIGIAMIFWLKLFDRVVSGWHQRFVVLISVPLGMSITNTHLSTFLLSFGGFFWLALFHFYKPGRTGAGEV